MVCLSVIISLVEAYFVGELKLYFKNDIIVLFYLTSLSTL